MRAFVEDQKILGYLLASGDSIGTEAAGESNFFHRIGFSRAEFRLLADALVSHSQTAQHISTVVTGFGTKHAFQCEMPTAPNGRRYCIKSVWMVENDRLRLITAHPARPA